MGGPGSTRWLSHIKKYQVEECLTLSIFELKLYIKVNYSGICKWYFNDKLTNSISYKVIGNYNPVSVQLSYKIKDSTEEKRIIRYIVDLTTTDLPWGGKRFWFQCPIIGCRNRVAKLYLPPNSVYFGCRNCHNLTYRSSQEQRAFASLYRSLANSLIGNYPGITPNHVKSVLSKRYEEGQFRDIFDDSHNKHESYLTREELLFESGLSEDRLNIIENAKLLLPDYKRLYRPKLVGWAKKLGYLLDDNWKIEEIYKWAKGRWSTPSPKKWPPDQDYWKTKDKE